MTSQEARRIRPRAGAWALCFSLVALVALPAAAADGQVLSGELTVTRISFTDTVDQSGAVELLHHSRAAPGPLPTMTVTGATMTWTQGETSGPVVQAGPLGFPTGGLDRTLGVVPGPAQQSDNHARFTVGAVQDGYIAHLYGSAPLQASARSGAIHLDSLVAPHLDAQYGIREATPSDPNQQTPSPYDFRRPTLAHEAARTTLEGQGSLTLTGSFTLELWGVAGTIHGDAGDHQVESGSMRDPVTPGAPDDNVYNERLVFLRIQVQDGRAVFDFPGDALTQWAGPQAGVNSLGQATLEAATGHVTGADGEKVAIDSTRFTLTGHHSFAMDPAGSTLQVGVRGLDADGNPLPSAATVHRIPYAVLGAVAAAILAIAAVALGAALAYRRLRHEPTMAAVEANLAAGHYRKAAREASLILRRKPGLEAALISRAIALSKSGRNERAVSEVEEHLRRTDPSDGVLHYVLGIAYSDLGKASMAEAAFQEALLRTPDLLPEVQARLPSVSRGPAPSTKGPGEPNGYA